jgi:hypothetical protein
VPPRSNDFQKLVFLVKKVLAGTGATVTESKMLRDLQTGDDREVDVCVEAEVAGHAVMICLECIDHTRPADIMWVEQMKAKHERLPTGSLVLASRSGFSKRAVSLAKIAGIELLTYKDVSQPAVESAVALTEDLWAMTYSLSATKVIATVPAAEGLPEERIAVATDTDCLDEDGAHRIAMAELVSAYLRDERLAEIMRRDGDETRTYFTVEIGTPVMATSKGVADLVFTYEATLNRYAMIPDGFRGCLGRRMALIRPNPDAVDGRFLLYYFFTDAWRAVIKSNTLTGATVGRRCRRWRR